MIDNLCHVKHADLDFLIYYYLSQTSGNDSESLPQNFSEMKLLCLHLRIAWMYATNGVQDICV